MQGSKHSPLLDRRVLVMALIGFGSGLPLKLIGQPLQAWMSDLKVDLGVIGLFSLVTLPYSLKLLWAPLMERFTPPAPAFLDRRRTWLLVTQLIVIGGIMAMAIGAPRGPNSPLLYFAMLAVFVAFASASQDIVADAYRTEVIPPERIGHGASVFVSGYRLALITSGALAMVLSKYMHWPLVYMMMAVMMAWGIVGTLAAPNVDGQAVAAAPTWTEAFVEPVRDFIGRNGLNTIAILGFIVLFRLPDSLAGAMTTPLLKHLAFTNTQIGLWQQAFGLGVGIPGAILGGVLVARIGLWRSLWVFGVLQAISNLGFTLLAAKGQSEAWLIGVTAVENICGGLVAAGFMAYLMSQCSQRYAAAQYAIFTSLMAVAGTGIGAPAGYLVQKWGYATFFAATVAAGLPGMAILPLLRPRKDNSRTFPVMPLPAQSPSHKS